jgi:hypothetical protein
MKRYLSRIAVVALAAGSVAVLGVSTAWAAPSATTVVLSGGKAILGQGASPIVATTSVAGSVSFTAAGTAIAGCSAAATTTVTPFIATCSWTPAVAGSTDLGATFTPTDAVNYSTATAAVYNINVAVPVQGSTASPVSIYTDTINTTGDKGVLAPKYGAGCSITSEFAIGQTIVWRVFANSADLGGAPLTPLNVASATVTVAGVATPLALSYGNHSGVAFWTAVLKTGTTAGLYNTLGVINYKVTIATIAVPAVTKQVKAIKYVPTIKNKKHVVVNGKGVFHQVSYTKTVVVTPAVPGATGVFQPAFTPLSQLTLNALPA